MDLPAGTYLIHGKVIASARDQNDAAVVCAARLGADGNDGAAQLEDEGVARLERPNVTEETLTVDDYVTLSEPGLVVLTCSSGGGDNIDPDLAFATRVRMIATPVTDLNVQPGLGGS